MISQTSATDQKEGAVYKTYLGAQVRWPPECPDDLLDDAINETHNALQMYDSVKEGRQVTISLNL